MGGPFEVITGGAIGRRAVGAGYEEHPDAKTSGTVSLDKHAQPAFHRRPFKAKLEHSSAVSSRVPIA